jgi:hypothetical protein
MSADRWKTDWPTRDEFIAWGLRPCNSLSCRVLINPSLSDDECCMDCRRKQRDRESRKRRERHRTKRQRERRERRRRKPRAGR